MTKRANEKVTPLSGGAWTESEILDLAARAGQGDLEAVYKLVTHPEVRRRMRKIAFSRARLLRELNVAFTDAEDLEQELYVKVLEKHTQSREPDRFFGWIRTIAGNLCISLGDKASNKAEIPQGDQITQYGGHSDNNQARRLALNEEISRLSEEERKVLDLRGEDYGYAQIAAKLGISVASAHRTYHKAMSRLLSAIGAFDDLD